MFDKISIEEVDLVARGISRTLLQFRDSTLFNAVLSALSEEVQELLDAIKAVIELRSPYDAKGVQLDSLGNIVGQNRTLVDFDTIVWFTPDTLGQSCDQVPIWIQNAPIAGDYEADDAWYRELIEAKVSRNFVQYSSVPEIQNYVKQSFNVLISIRTVDIMTVQLVVSDNASPNVMNALERYIDTDRAEHIYWLPLAATVQIASIIKFSELGSSSL